NGERFPMSTSTKRTRPSLTLEALEDRLVLSNYASMAHLYINGTSGNNMAIVTWTGSKIHVDEEGTINDKDYLPSQVWKGILYHGKAGNDVFVNNTPL